MVKLFVVLGLALLAGGAYAIVDGWPYLVLERGLAEVILGALAAIAGLILLALAAVLAEVRRLKGLVSGAMAVMALSERRSDQEPGPNETPTRPDPVLENDLAPEAGHSGIATTLVAGAGAAAAAGVLTSLAKAEELPGDKAVGKTEKTDEQEEEEDGARSDPAETVAAEPSPSVVTREADDWLLPPVPAVFDAVPSVVARDASGEAAMKTEAPEDEQVEPTSALIDEPSHQDDEEIDRAEPAAVPVDESEAKQAEEEGEPVKPEIAPASSPEDRLWWPSITPPASAATTSVDDEFTALRDQLVGVVNAPEVEPPRRDHDTPGAEGNWIAPRAWPPVTHPRNPDALGDVDAEAADKVSPAEAEIEPLSVETEAAVLELEKQGEPAQEESHGSPQGSVSAETETPPAEEAESVAATRPGEEPAASEEGVIGAYQVGETQFTMFADGSIHARTPDGDYTFASMDELKTYLASEKDKLQPGSN